MKSITSLEKENTKGKRVYQKHKLDAAKKGKIIPVPIDEIKSDHWSGIDHRGHYVSDKYLYHRKHTKKSTIKSKYLED